jgi:hypothetical protein
VRTLGFQSAKGESYWKSYWMAERLATLLATQVARVRFPVPARPTSIVEKLALVCNPTSGGSFSSTAIEIMKRLKFAVAKAKV